MRSFEEHHHAAELRELRKVNANDEAFVGGIKDELQAMLSSIVGPTSRSVVARINAVGHRLTPNDAREHPTELCVGYACATPGPGQMRELLFELLVSVVTVDEDAVPLPTEPDADEHIEIEAVSPEALAERLRAGEGVRDVERRLERAAEYRWLLNVQSTWDEFVDRLQSIGYDFQQVFLDECALDIRDSALRIHVGLSAIVRAIAPTESALDC